MKIITSGEAELTLTLENGSLCVFDGRAGKINYKHEVPKGLIRDGHSNLCITGKDGDCPMKLSHFSCSRINVTFRTMN